MGRDVPRLLGVVTAGWQEEKDCGALFALAAGSAVPTSQGAVLRAGEEQLRLLRQRESHILHSDIGSGVFRAVRCYLRCSRRFLSYPALDWRISPQLEDRISGCVAWAVMHAKHHELHVSCAQP